LNSTRRGGQAAQTEQVIMRFVLKAVLFLVVAAGVALLGLAIFSDLPAPTREISVPVEAK